MHYIIGDIGNTSTRICILNDKSKILKSVIFDTKKIYLKGYINNIFKKLSKKKNKKRSAFFMRGTTSFKKNKKSSKES